MMGAWSLGDQIGPYRLEAELGRGGMGVVYLATDPAGQRQVAVKTLSTSAPPRVRERFEREGLAQARVDQHPNVASIHELGVHEGRMFIVQGYASGGDLGEAIKLQGRLSLPDAQRIVAGIAKGVAHLHAAGVIHRDLKPANVLLHQDGTPILVDFGVAKVLDAESLTRTGEAVGTVSYMAPEQVDEAHRVDARADVYGLGAILYACLTGAPPFAKGSAISTLNALLTQAPAPLATLRPNLPPAWQGLIDATLAKDPDERFSDVGEFSAALLAAPCEAAPDRRGPLVALVVLALLLVLAAGGTAILSLREVVAPPPTPTLSAPPAPAPSPVSPARWVVGTGSAHYDVLWTEQALSKMVYTFRARLVLTRHSQTLVYAAWTPTALGYQDHSNPTPSALSGNDVPEELLSAGHIAGKPFLIVDLTSGDFKVPDADERRQQIGDLFRKTFPADSIQGLDQQSAFLRGLVYDAYDSSLGAILQAGFRRGEGTFLGPEGSYAKPALIPSSARRDPLSSRFTSRFIPSNRTTFVGLPPGNFRLERKASQTRVRGHLLSTNDEAWPREVVLAQEIQAIDLDLSLSLEVRFMRVEPKPEDER